MKKTILAGWVILLLAATGCTREPMPGEGHIGGELRATIATGSTETRTVMVDKSGLRMESFWSGGDRIGVAGASGAVTVFSLAAADISDGAKSAIFRTESSVPEGTVTAFCPYQEGAKVVNGKIEMEFPATQYFTRVNGVAQPDPSANIMVGTGSAAGGVAFRNVMAILKIGHTFPAATTVSRVEFRDLSGSPVAGAVSITPDAEPSFRMTGGGSVLSLDCGTEGVSLLAGETGRFYLIIPARTYPKGIEVTFVAADGSKTVKTSGKAKGVTYERNLIYPLGDIPSRDYAVDPSTVKLSDGAVLVTPEALRQMEIIRCVQDYVRDENGTALYNGTTALKLPKMDIVAPIDMDIRAGGWLVFDAIEQMPSGGVLKVESVEKPFGDGQHQLVKAVPTNNPIAAYKSLEVGSKIYDDDGNLIEGGGLGLDLASYVSEVRDGDGNPVPFTRSADGQLLFSEETLSKAITRAAVINESSLSTPKLTMEHSTANGFNCKFGVGVTVNMRSGMSIKDGELEWLNFTFNPVIDRSFSFSIKGEISTSKSLHLLTIYCVPGIPIAPGVILTPELEISASIGAGGNLEFGVTMDCHESMGTFGCSYLRGQGFTFRHKEDKPDPNNPLNASYGASLTGSLFVKGGLTFTPAISLYGLLKIGIVTDVELEFGIQYGAYTSLGQSIGKLYLTPKITFTPQTATLGGWFSNKWKDYARSIEFDPLWERYLAPVVIGGGGIAGPLHKFRYIQCPDGEHIIKPAPDLEGFMYTQYNYTHIDGYHYTATSKVPTLDPWEYVMEVWKGTTTGEEQHGQLWNAAVYDGYSGCDKQRLREGEEWARLEDPEDVVLLSIPSGQRDEVTETDTRGTFLNGHTYGITFNYVNKRTGKKLLDNKAPGNCFRVVWHDIGPQYVKVKVTPEEYQRYNGSLISDTWSSASNAYFDGMVLTNE